MISDTTSAAEQRQHEIFKQMSGERRLLLAMAFSERIRDIAMEGLRRRHPSAPEGALKTIYFKEMYGLSLPGLPGRKTR
ncbi:MAG: hypothetical protein MUC33_07655 [Desulfobacterales bacterium]|jgi:hypothetical protein|nr:hypothetical protein [Desulfobacterales bacterium]